jgi:hypothetical protein
VVWQMKIKKTFDGMEKDFDAQTITYLKLNLFSFFIYCCQHNERKTTCLDIFLLSDRQWGTEHQYPFSRFLGVSIIHRCQPLAGAISNRKKTNLILKK